MKTLTKRQKLTIIIVAGVLALLAIICIALASHARTGSVNKNAPMKATNAADKTAVVVSTTAEKTEATTETVVVTTTAEPETDPVTETEAEATPAHDNEENTTTTATTAEPTTTTEATTSEPETVTTTNTTTTTEAITSEPETTTADNPEGMYTLEECFRRKAEEYSGHKVVKLNADPDIGYFEIVLENDEKVALEFLDDTFSSYKPTNMYSIDRFRKVNDEIPGYLFIIALSE